MTPIIKLLIGDSRGNKDKDIYTIKLIQPYPNLPSERYKNSEDKL